MVIETCTNIPLLEKMLCVVVAQIDRAENEAKAILLVEKEKVEIQLFILRG